MISEEEEYFRRAENLLEVACYALQLTFRNQWELITGEEWTPENSQDLFKEGHLKEWFYDVCSPLEQHLLDKGNFREWSLDLLLDLLGQKFITPEDEKFAHIRKSLGLLRHSKVDVVTNKRKKMSTFQYQQIVRDVSLGLSLLGVESKDIDKWISQAIRNSADDALQQAMSIEILDTNCSWDDCRNTVKRYDQALMVPTLIPVEFRGSLYEQKAFCYLELGVREKDEVFRSGYLYLAKRNVKIALEYNKYSWKAHSILARAYQAESEVEKALHHSNKVVSLCPAEYNQTVEELVKDFKDKLVLTIAGQSEVNADILEETVNEQDVGSYRSETSETEVSEDSENLSEVGSPSLEEEHKESIKPQFRLRCIDAYQRDFDVLSQRAEEGSVTAKKIHTCYRYIDELNQLWGDGPHHHCGEEVIKRIIQLMYTILCIDYRLLGFTNPQEMREVYGDFIVSQLEEHRGTEGELDKWIRICYGFHPLRNEGYRDKIEIVKEGLQRYPYEPIYHVLLTYLCFATQEYETGLHLANQGLALFPNHWDLLYNRAFHCCPNVPGDWTEEICQSRLDFFQDFLNQAPEDDWRVAVACYSITQLYLHIVALADLQPNKRRAAEKKMLEFYEKAQGAEEKLLPCYLPFKHYSKENVNKTFTQWKEAQQLLTAYVRDPKLIELRKEHRAKQKALSSKENSDFNPPPAPKLSAIMQKLIPTNWKESDKLILSNITLKEMDPTQDKVYGAKKLTIAIIEDPIFERSDSPKIHLLAMDGNRDVVRVFIYNLPHNELSRNALGFGRRLTIANPFMRMTPDFGNKNGIRVDEPNYLFPYGVENICRYCLRPGATSHCARCNLANYCYRECQLADWRELDHKLVCKKKDSPK